MVALPGLEPGLFALRGRRVNQLHHNAIPCRQKTEASTAATSQVYQNRNNRATPAHQQVILRQAKNDRISTTYDIDNKSLALLAHFPFLQLKVLPMIKLSLYLSGLYRKLRCKQKT